MNNLILIVLALVEVLLAAALAYGFYELRRMRRDARELSQRLAAQQADVTGLCSAGLALDRRVVQSEQRLTELTDWVASQRTEDKLQPAYHGAIDLIRRGANLDQLVSHCGISREEAALLLRLHGGG